MGASAGGRFVGSIAAAALLGSVILITHGFGVGLVAAMLPRITQSFRSGYGVLGLALSVGLAAYGLGAALGIKAVDRLPSRGLLILCLAVCGSGFLAASAASSPGMLALSVMVIGICAPVSWSASVNIAGAAVDPRHHGRVLAVASAGTGIGYGLNGVFVHTMTGAEEWRWAFVIAAAAAAATIAGTLLVFHRPIELPFRMEETGREGAWRQILLIPGGRAVILMSVVSGLAGLTFAAYMAEIAVHELALSPLAAAFPWWLAAGAGSAAALPLGWLADRGSPVGVVSAMAGAYAALLGLLALRWSHPALLAAALAYGVLNFPVWGLIGLAAHRSLPPLLAVRAVSGGLVAASLSAAVSIAVSGAWIDRTGSFRGPTAVLAVLAAALTLWFRAGHRTPAGGRGEDLAEAIESLWLGESSSEPDYRGADDR